MNPLKVVFAIILGAFAGLAWFIAFFILSAAFIFITGSFQLVSNESGPIQLYEMLLFGPAILIFISTLVIFLKKPSKKPSRR